MRGQYARQLKICRTPTAKRRWSCAPEKLEFLLGRDETGWSRSSRTAGRRLRSADGEAVLLVWRGLLQGVPPTAQSAIHGSCAAGRAEIGAEPLFGYRTVAGLPGMNKRTVQRIFQLKG